jgi:hypothetical protein
LEEHPFANIEGSKIIRKGFLDVPDREIGEIREDAASSVQYFENRFSIIEQKVEALEKNIDESTNKGSFLMKLIHLKEYITTFDGIGDFEKLYQRLEDKEKYLQEIIHQNRIKNYEIKKAFLAELELLKDHFNIREAAERIREIRNNWIKTGAILEEYRDEIENKFEACIDHFNKRKDAYYEDRRLSMEDTEKQYQEILKRAEKLYVISDIRESTKRLKDLQQEWKKLGRIPPEPYNEFKNRFQKINDDLFNKLRAFQEEQLQHRQKKIQQVFDLKTKLLDEFNEKIHQNAGDLFHLKNEYLDRWKRLGNLFSREINALNDKFYSRITYINEILFVDKIARKKSSNFDQLDLANQYRIKIKVLSELIERDEKDLHMYNRNMEVFNFRRGAVDKFNSKRNDKQKSLIVKKELLEAFKKDLNMK